MSIARITNVAALGDWLHLTARNSGSASDRVFTPWRNFGGEANDFLTMKSLVIKRNATTRMEKPDLTLGELIARTYRARGEKNAPNILHLAMEAHVIRYSQPHAVS
jgi:hypothetical protein